MITEDMPNNTNLNKAIKSKNDEWYTKLADIEKEMQHYTEYFENKIIYCNCDDPVISNFFVYFSENFEKLKLKKLITTCYKTRQQDLFGEIIIAPAVCTITQSLGKTERHNLQGDGDFRSEECQELLRQADIIVTNPPFSLFKEYVAQLMKFEKKFLIIGNLNAISYTKIFPYLQNQKIKFGFNSGSMEFICGKNNDNHDHNYYQTMTTNVCWYTNLEIGHKTNHHIECTKKYNPKDYPQYDNYNAININKVSDIPIDYDGPMGVPKTFMLKYNPEQFFILGHDHAVKRDLPGELLQGKRLADAGKSCLAGEELYARIFIKHKKNGVVMIGDDEKRGGYFESS